MRPLLVLCLTLSLGAIASCGGDDSSSDGSPDASTSSDSGAGSTPDTASDTVATPDAEPTPDADAVATPDAVEDIGDLTPEGCRTHAECADSDSEFGMYCATPYDPKVCGIAPMEECWDDQQYAGIGAGRRRLGLSRGAGWLQPGRYRDDVRPVLRQ